jgi:hypothetical protein
MPNLRSRLPILLCLALAACTWNPFAQPDKKAPKRTRTGSGSHRTVPPEKKPTPAQKVASPVIGGPVVASTGNRPKDVQSVRKAAGDTLRQLSKEQAQNALNELKPGGPVSDDPQEEITAMLIDATAMEKAQQILKALQHAKQE